MSKLSKQPLKIVITTIGFITLFLVVYTLLHWSPSGGVYQNELINQLELPLRLRNYEEHDIALNKNNGNPYILQFNTDSGGSLLYYGAYHSSDPNDPQIQNITSLWEEFSPTVALYEGRSRGYFYGALIEPFAGLPEPALVHKLARKDKVDLYSLEPSYEEEVRIMLQQYSKEQIALYFFLRVYSSESGGVANEALALDLLRKRTDVDGLQGALSTISDLDKLWAQDFQGNEDWRIIQIEPGYLATISSLSREIRGEHMAKILIALVNKGERVFAVVGSGHVIRQEWILRLMLEQEPAWDQPIVPTLEP